MALVLYGGTVEDCTKVGSLSHIVNTGISPLRPKAGDTSYLWVNFDLSQTVTAGTVTYSYSWNYIPFEPTTVSLCDETLCPLYPGIQNVTGNSTFPDVSGLVQVQVEWADDIGTPIWCVQTTYTL